MSVIVYFFSRYNEKSLELSKLLTAEDIDMKKICVDNENVRERILDSELDIKKVPTILIFHPSQEIEKYNGEECFEWYNYLKQKNRPQNEFNTERIPVEQIENESLNTNKLSQDNKLLDDIVRREDTQTINNENEELKASLKINKGNDTEGILMRAQKMQKERDFLGNDNKQSQPPSQQPPLQSSQPPLQPPLQSSQPPLQPPLQSSQPPLQPPLQPTLQSSQIGRAHV